MQSLKSVDDSVNEKFTMAALVLTDNKGKYFTAGGNIKIRFNKKADGNEGNNQYATFTSSNGVTIEFSCQNTTSN